MTSSAADIVKRRVAEALAGFDHRWVLMPLSGKQPVQLGWSEAPPPTREDVERWARKGNIGMRTGRISGVVVVDLDEGCSINGLDLPRTVTVKTGSGGRHLYYQAPDREIRNSAGKLANHIDIRGDGGQVVYPGSIHPDTGAVYEWADGLGPDEVEMALLPESISNRLSKPDHAPSERLLRRGGNGTSPYAAKAFESEVAKVHAAPNGGRNDQLNKSAFALGQFVGGGELSQLEVETELLAATALPGDEARATIASGLKAGAREPRVAPHRPTRESADAERPTVLVPGAHLDDEGNYHEIGEGRFARNVLDHIPQGRLYLRGEPAVPGEIRGEQGSRYFNPLESDSVRLVMGDYVRLVKWVKQAGPGRQVQTVRTAMRTLAGLVLAEAPNRSSLRRLELIVPFPAHGCSPGWNANGMFYDEAPALRGLRPQKDREIIDNTLEDLLVDFPFKDEASRQNFIGLLLTPLLRSSIDGNVPLHLMLSPLERTGKTKLVEEVLGGVLLGYPTPALQLTGSDEEIDKRLVGLLLKGKPIVHLDNLRAYIDSAALSSLLTASRYQGRVLGSNAMPELRNRTVLVASGNNVRMSSEMAKRTVPIGLQPADDAPEMRRDFQHPDLRSYIRSVRRLVMECLLGMIARWEDAGRPEGEARLGGFEAWASTVGGVMTIQGYDEWLSNLQGWQREADPHGEDLNTFVAAWHSAHGMEFVSPNQLLSLALDNEVFLGEVRGATDRGRLNSFSKRVLGRHKDTPVGGFIIRQDRTSQARLWRLERNRGVCSDTS